MISSDFFRPLFDREFIIASEILSEEYGLKTIDGFTTSLTYSLKVIFIRSLFYSKNDIGRSLARVVLLIMNSVS